ncbi:AraC family transcriptional regulator [Paenibacillus alginolyticus]|uniref:AraC family transcriptional regulator n=1 Tax=Paenibacillus alginolyticus TaxID=59839 RepID=A0ABT4GQF9_9BACL|nr:AraC family transcriptional regulator [Paenibacillus alginolyticus]MCY9698229.1 AraC family transcriptional regulator [Paenibacillus alginolyticus]MEC0147745.1 AraC family transcriptional regulator [Paenibacillus alginolyticus]
MTRKWMKRQIISYLPVFFLLTFVLLTLMFLSIAQLSKNAVIDANGVFAKHVQQVVDYNLKTTEHLVLNAVQNNENVKPYFQQEDAHERFFKRYQISNELTKLKVNSIIDSIYLYRKSDDKVLSENMFTPLQEFGDQAFIQERLNDSKNGQKWSNVRIFQETKSADSANKVISFASRANPLSGDLGIIVVNVKIKAIEQLVNEMSSPSDVSYASLIGKDGQYIYDAQLTGDSKQLHEFTSDYTGWKLLTGIKDLYQFGSWVYYVYLSIGVLMLVLGTIWIIYTARSNYRPIQSILGRITRLSTKKGNLFQDEAADEFTLIEAAIEDLFERVTEYEKEQEEGLTLKRHHILKDLTDGRIILQEMEWKKEMENLRLSSEFTFLCSAIIEIDRNAEFAQSYSKRDQYLLKFVINNVLKEISDQYPIEIWMEWLERHRLSILFLSQSDLELSETHIANICNRMVEWVQNNLDFSITFAVSQCSSDSREIYHLYEQARTALNYKSVKGNNQVIYQAQINEIKQGEAYKLIHNLRYLSYYYRMGEARWKEEFEILFRQILDDMYAKSEVFYIINDLINHLYREIMELPDEFQTIWKRDVMPKMNNMLREMETVEETKLLIMDVLLHAEQQFLELRETRKHHALMQNVRKYIEEHYSNPELSLNHLEDEFGINGKYLSFLFREEIGVKFVDYLSQVRLEYAKVLLLETQSSVQDIANQVGYTNSMTFIRAFKKCFGVTPGEYRKM